MLVLSLISYVLSLALGFALPGPEGGSDNPYLRPDNALRLAKGFFMALALLPFLRARMRTQGDTMVWFGAGMVTGLALVAATVLIERALFVGILDFTTDYRVVGTFSSMNIGGGYIGAYLAMSLPFLLVFTLRPRVVSLLVMIGIAIGAGYALVVTYARTAYAAALISMLIAGLGWSWATRRSQTSVVSAAAPLVLVLVLTLIGGIVTGTLASDFMAERLRQVVPDLADREVNWSSGLALRDDDLGTVLFGTGLGTYPRIVITRKPDERFPTNFVVSQDGGYDFLSLRAGLPIYFGQKVRVRPDQQYRLFATFRSLGGEGTLGVILCEKMLLYSENCRGETFGSRSPGVWEDFGMGVSTVGLEHPILGWFNRPVELAFVNPVSGTSIDIGHMRMLDPQGRDVLDNGDFSRGTERWYFTDDEHRIWRIENQYLMSLFEGGALALVALLLLVGTALAGTVRAVGRGDRMGAAVMGSLAAFLCSCAFDDLLGVPRLATLFYLVAFNGLTMLQQARRRPTMS
jgi:O-antigen ligase